jgi:uncharacterized protein (TIGR02266 family)
MVAPAMSQDTRKAPRAKVEQVSVRYKSATVDEFIENHSHDVSSGGVFIKTNTPFPPGTLLKFEIRTEDEKALIAGVGRVVWKREEMQAGGDSQPAGMGVKFIKVDETSRSIIDRLISTHPEAGTAYESGTAAAGPVPEPVPTRPGVGPQRKSTVIGMGDETFSPSSLMDSMPPSGPNAPLRMSSVRTERNSVPPSGLIEPMFPSPTAMRSVRPAAPAPGAPREEPTMMRHAAELLEEAAREVGAEEARQNPLFAVAQASTPPSQAFSSRPPPSSAGPSVPPSAAPSSQAGPASPSTPPSSQPRLSTPPSSQPRLSTPPSSQPRLSTPPGSVRPPEGPTATTLVQYAPNRDSSPPPSGSTRSSAVTAIIDTSALDQPKSTPPKSLPPPSSSADSGGIRPSRRPVAAELRQAESDERSSGNMPLIVGALLLAVAAGVVAKMKFGGGESSSTGTDAKIETPAPTTPTVAPTPSMSAATATSALPVVAKAPEEAAKATDASAKVPEVPKPQDAAAKAIDVSKATPEPKPARPVAQPVTPPDLPARPTAPPKPAEAPVETTPPTRPSPSTTPPTPPTTAPPPTPPATTAAPPPPTPTEAIPDVKPTPAPAPPAPKPSSGTEDNPY